VSSCDSFYRAALQISLKNLQNESKRKIALPFNQANFMFNATIGHVLVRTVDALYLFELEGRKVPFLLQRVCLGFCLMYGTLILTKQPKKKKKHI